jgi:hypothetical protein
MKRKQDDDDEEVVSHRFLEYALSGWGGCGVCGKPIHEGELRYGTKVHIPETAIPAHDSVTWRCLACVRGSLRGSRKIRSFHSTLTPPSQITYRQAENIRAAAAGSWSRLHSPKCVRADV